MVRCATILAQVDAWGLCCRGCAESATAEIHQVDDDRIGRTFGSDGGTVLAHNGFTWARTPRSEVEIHHIGTGIRVRVSEQQWIMAGEHPATAFAHATATMLSSLRFAFGR